MTDSSANPSTLKLREKLRDFPEEFQQAVLGFKGNPTPAALDVIVIGLLRYHTGETFTSMYEEKGGAVLLAEDLGLDSLALIEVSFQAEEFIGFVLQIQDFENLATLGDLQNFLRGRIFPSGQPATD
jgi:hypothetical protein